MDQVFDAIRGLSGVLVLPHLHHGPACLCDLPPSRSVAASVGVNLGGPEVRIGLRNRVVLRATVPEAPIDVHGQPQAGKHDVGGTAYVAERRTVHEEPEASTVKLSSQGKLRPGVPTAIGSHA